MDYATDADRADLARAEALVDEGKKLRIRVFARIRKRRQRAVSVTRIDWAFDKPIIVGPGEVVTVILPDHPAKA